MVREQRQRRVWIAPWAAPRDKDLRPVFVLLVTGSRDADEQAHCDAMNATMQQVVAKYPGMNWRLVMVNGDADTGADPYLAEWAKVTNTFSEVWLFPAEWEKHKPPAGSTRKNPAGPIRNQEMVDHVVSERALGAKVGCLAFPSAADLAAEKGGTVHCMRAAEKAGIIAMVRPVRTRRK